MGCSIKTGNASDRVIFFSLSLKYIVVSERTLNTRASDARPPDCLDRGAFTRPVGWCKSNAFQTDRKKFKQIGLGPRKTSRRKHPLKKRLFSETVFFATPLCVCVSRAKILKTLETQNFAHLAVRVFVWEQTNSQVNRSQDIASKWQKIEHGAKRSSIRRSCWPRWSCTGQQAKQIPPCPDAASNIRLRTTDTSASQDIPTQKIPVELFLHAFVRSVFTLCRICFFRQFQTS